VKALIQRVTRAAVRVDGQTVGEIGSGLLVLLGIGKSDTHAGSDWMINKLLSLRIFADADGKMNRSVTDTGGAILVVSQFTLYGALEKGTRPSFSDAMPPGDAATFYEEFMRRLRAATALRVEEGRFGAMMEVELVNDGPVTILVERASSPLLRRTGILPVHPETTTGLEAGSTQCSASFIPFDPSTAVAKHERNLPHWEQAGRTYFVTFRLADSLPQDKLRQWSDEKDQWLKQHPTPHSPSEAEEYRRLFTDRLDCWLDEGTGSCCLRQPEAAAMVAETLNHFDGQRYALGAFVVMPNHVHVLVTPLGEWTLEQILHSWKSYSANQINRLLCCTGSCWQPEYFDHLVRNEQELQRVEQYIRQNPIHARLREGEYRLPEQAQRAGSPFYEKTQQQTRT